MITLLLPLAALLPAADSSSYLVLNHGRPAGEMIVVRAGDSTIVRYRHIDRNRGQRLETRYRLAENGDLLAAEVQPMTLDGRPSGSPSGFRIAGDSVRWYGAAPGGRGGAAGGGATPPPTRVEPGTFYRVGSSTPFDQLLLARFLLRQPRFTGRLYPSGTARLEVVAETTPAAGGVGPVRFAVLHGWGAPTAPSGIWLDARNDLVASEVGWFQTVRPGAESALPVLRAAEIRYRNAQAEALARSLATPAGGTLVIRNGDVFDSERGIVLPRTTVVVRGERIISVGAADSLAVPAGATVIDATGKSVIPGMYDMHTHYGLTSQLTTGPAQLAGGITTIRDLASDLDVAVLHRDREQSGAIVGPRGILAGFLEGPGAWAGPSEALVRTESEARAWIARYDSSGFRQIKVYNLVHPDLIPAIAEETHRRGMRLSGHIPRGLTVPAAIALGFDEVQHGAFLFSTFFQDSLYTPVMRPYSGVAAVVAPNVNVDGPEVTSLIELLRRSGTVVDGTFNLWQRGPGPDGQVDAGSANYGRLVKRLYDAGVTLVPGTDANTVPAYLNELQLYERDGIPAPNVLQIATIVPARVMKEEKDYGSIAAGKIADLVIVNGKPYERVADLQRVEHVVHRGRLYRSADLLSALRPAPATP
jgi:hypothetical protein